MQTAVKRQLNEEFSLHVVRRKTPEDRSLYNHLCENLISYKLLNEEGINRNENSFRGMTSTAIYNVTT
jgi:hypothetical protein